MASGSSTETIADAMERTRNRSSGFDYLRIALSVAVLVWHSARVCYPDFGMGTFLRPTAGMILPMFFALSGFLVSGSFFRTKTISEFITLRVIRIAPALLVETAFSVLIIGTLFTTLPVSAYFSDPLTHKYLLNMLGIVQFVLPGVFKSQPIDAVNLSLWTVPIELECYLLLIVLWLTRISRSPRALLTAAIAVQIIVPILDHYTNRYLDPSRPVSGRVLLVAFMFGALLYSYRDKIKLHWLLFVGSCVLSTICLLFGPLSYFVALPAAYITVYLGMKNPPKLPIIFSGDYSYGIYLYAFPIQQSVYLLLPAGMREWWILAPLALALVSVFAAFSWHVVEKPILSKRKQLVGAMGSAAGRIGLASRSAEL